MSGAPAEAIAAARNLLTDLDRCLPDRVAGLYLIGSAVLGDFRRASDVDLAVVCDRALSAEEVATVRGLHRRLWLRKRRNLDMFFTTFEEMSKPPAQAKAGFTACGFRTRVGVGAKNPVAWAMLSRSSMALRGPVRESLSVHDDEQDLRQWCRENLSTYWRRWLAASRTHRHWRRYWAMTPHACIWGALSVARIHHTILTGQIVSKSAAAETARRCWPSDHALLAQEAVRLRHGEPSRGKGLSPWRRRRALLSAVNYVVALEGA